MRGTSLTAWAVSLARGVSRTTTGEPLDPFAKELLPAALSLPARLLYALNGSKLRARILDRTSLGLFSHILFRTGAIDRELLAFVDRTVSPQILLLGAGADARAYRLPQLRGAHVFEVDHPATQRDKKRRAEALTPVCEITYVPVNFEQDSLDVALDVAGFDRDAPTFCIWEGVTPYLTEDAVNATLRMLHELLSPSSVLAVTYGLPNMLPHLPERGRPVIGLFFKAIGEPLNGLVTQARFSSWLTTHGYQTVSDTSVYDWARTEDVKLPAVLILERLAIAVRA